jgi:two-component system, OmpR family, phosphate regulon sensor histidine kinase PhoR
VLEYGQLEQGLRRYTFERVNAATLVSELLDQYRPYFAHLGFTVDATVDEHVPHLRADHQAVTQAVVNLLDNAMKYSGDATTVEMRVRGREHDVVIEVEDHGAGLDHRDRDRLFEPFYRAGRATGRGGYGLGLHVVEQIMHAHGGRIEIESDPGRGSCFRLVFPPETPAT